MIKFANYGQYKSDNYGSHTLVFTDSKRNEIYFSYKTVVAFWTQKTGLICCENMWSNTTGKHLNWIQADKKKRVDFETFKKLYRKTFRQEYNDNY